LGNVYKVVAKVLTWSLQEFLPWIIDLIKPNLWREGTSFQQQPTSRSTSRSRDYGMGRRKQQGPILLLLDFWGVWENWLGILVFNKAIAFNVTWIKWVSTL
jgi:hypothetical protein